MMRLREFEIEGTPKAARDRITRNVTELVLEDEGARERRLLETALALILFEQTNEQVYYRHLLCVEHLHGLLQLNKDLQEFHGARSVNTSAAIRMQVDACRRAQEGIAWGKAWYLGSTRSLPEGNLTAEEENGLLRYVKPSSIRHRYKLAARQLTDNERLAIGMSYAEAYGDPSRAVHFAALRRPGSEVSGAVRVGLLTMVIIDRCHALLGRPKMKMVDQMSQALETNAYAKERVRDLSLGDVEVGDFVLASDYLAEVLEMKQSSYGNRSFRIRFMAERPLPDVIDDWFAARHVKRLYSRKVLLTKLRENPGGLPAEAVSLLREAPEHLLQDALRDSMIAIWHAGLRDALRKPPIGEKARKTRR